MALFILRLEDRILFDAAAPTAFAQVVADAADPAHTDSANADAAEATDASQSDTAQVAGSESLTEAISAVQEGQTNVLLISSNVENAEQLANAAADDVITILYDYKNTTLDQLQTMISDALNGQVADTISFATEGQSGDRSRALA